MNKWIKEISEIPNHYVADDSGYKQRLYLEFAYWLLFKASRHNLRKVDDTPTDKRWYRWLVTACTLDGKMGVFHIPGIDNSLPRWVIGFRPSSKVRVGDRDSSGASSKVRVGDRDSSGGIATRYGLEGPGIESRWGEIFCTYPDRLRGPPSLLCNGYRLFPGGKGGWGVMLTTHPF
jgi:hypothetical protein